MSRENFKKLFALILPHTRLNKSLRILVVTNSILVFIIGLFAPFYAVFIQRVGGNIASAGFLWAIFLIVAGLLIFFFSKWELKVKKNRNLYLAIAAGNIVI